MDRDRKYLARSFYFLLYQFLRYRYENVDVVFISHSTEAKEVGEDDFFKRSNSGGTMMSSAFELEKDIIEKRYHPSRWNIYTFYCGDGENWTIDNEKTVNLMSSLSEMNQLVSYGEINPLIPDDPVAPFLTHPPSDADSGSMWARLGAHEGSNIKRIRIRTYKDIWPAFNRLFGGRSS